MKPQSIFYWVVVGFIFKGLFSCLLLLISLLVSTSLIPELYHISFYMVPKISLSMPIQISSMLLLPSSAPQSDLRSSRLSRWCKNVARGCFCVVWESRHKWDLCDHSLIRYTYFLFFLGGGVLAHLWRVPTYPTNPFLSYAMFVFYSPRLASISYIPRSRRNGSSFCHIAAGAMSNFSKRVFMLHRWVRFSVLLLCLCVTL